MTLPPEWEEKKRRALDPTTPTDELAELADDLGLIVVQNPSVTADIVRSVHEELNRNLISYEHLPSFYHVLHENPARDFFLLDNPRFFVDLFSRQLVDVAIFETMLKSVIGYNPYAFIQGYVPSKKREVSFTVPKKAREFFLAEAARWSPEAIAQSPPEASPSTSYELALWMQRIVRLKFGIPPRADTLLFLDTVARVWKDEFGLPSRRLPAPGVVAFAQPHARYEPSR